MISETMTHIKKELESKGISCPWENSWNCNHHEDCIEFGRCIFKQEWEDSCL